MSRISKFNPDNQARMTAMGRLVVMTGLAILILGLLVACGSPLPPPTTTAPPVAETLIFYNWADEMPQSILDAFAAEYEVEVTYLTYDSQEELVENIRAGNVYDVVVVENNFVPSLAVDGLLAEIDYRHVLNFDNISINFRNLAYDPDNLHSVPYTWGTTGLVVRSDLVVKPVTSWRDLWEPSYTGQVVLWRGESRNTIGLALKSLGYSVNSEEPSELEEALMRLIELKPIFGEDFDSGYGPTVFVSGQGVLGLGYADQVLEGREENEAITYVLPQEGTLLWGDNFVIPANSPRKETAELFINFALRPEMSAQLTNENHYATSNEAAYPFIDSELRDDPVIFPPSESLKNAEVILPLSAEGEQLHSEIWQRFLSAQE